MKIIKFLHSRKFQFIWLPILVLGWFLYTDPSQGSDTLLRVQLWAQALFVVWMAYAISKAFTGKASSEKLYDSALEGNTGAGIAYLGIILLRAIILFSLLLFFALVQR